MATDLPSACHACNRECKPTFDSDWTHSRTMEPVRFYLHEDGAFNFSRIERHLDTLLHGRPPDTVLPVNDAQYLLDLPIIMALRSSPYRTYDRRRAAAHILAAMPSIMLQQALNMPSSSSIHRCLAV